MTNIQQDTVGFGHVRWVFAYGSLMWNPGFPYLNKQPATLPGYQRSFCIYSHHYRGTPEKPGLVLGLDKGENCRGMAFEIAAATADDVVAYLNERELTGYAYRPAVLDIVIADATVSAYTFITDRTHRQYAGDLGSEKAAALIMAAKGESGLNRDYLMNVIHQLTDMGFRDEPLLSLLACIEHQTGLLEQGGGI